MPALRAASDNLEEGSNATVAATIVWYRPTQRRHLLVSLNHDTVVKRKTCIVPEGLYFRIASLYFIYSSPLWDSLLHPLTLHPSSGLVYIATWISSRITAWPSSVLRTYISLIEQLLFIRFNSHRLSSHNPITKMDISDMLNPESLSEEVHPSLPQAHTRTQNITNTPRSTLSPATQLSSLSPAHSYCHGYDSYNTATQPYQAPPIDSRVYEIGSFSTLYSQHRKPAVDSAIGRPSGGYGNSSSDYVPTKTSSSHIPVLIPRSLGTTSQDRPSQNRNVMSSSQGLYTHTQPQGADSLAALATLATSRDFRDNNGQEIRRWGSHQWDLESTAWGRQALSEGYHETQLRRGSQSSSPHGTVNDVG